MPLDQHVEKKKEEKKPLSKVCNGHICVVKGSIEAKCPWLRILHLTMDETEAVGEKEFVYLRIQSQPSVFTCVPFSKVALTDRRLLTV